MSASTLSWSTMPFRACASGSDIGLPAAEIRLSLTASLRILATRFFPCRFRFPLPATGDGGGTGTTGTTATRLPVRTPDTRRNRDVISTDRSLENCRRKRAARPSSPRISSVVSGRPSGISSAWATAAVSWSSDSCLATGSSSAWAAVRAA
ncbi:Uncharacterised protein [Mycobacteroides abscessus subsp. abscessus]|nr:Uncharacterised protein [Mycobacteroides abscessus subsp. abscessus]